jgi:hypothetical protein
VKPVFKQHSTTTMLSKPLHTSALTKYVYETQLQLPLDFSVSDAIPDFLLKSTKSTTDAYIHHTTKNNQQFLFYFFISRFLKRSLLDATKKFSEK